MKILTDWDVDWTFFLSVGAILSSTALAYGYAHFELGAEDSEDTEGEEEVAKIDSPLRYSLNDPEISRELPTKLREVSGLVVNPAGGIGWAINDEEGLVFELDLQTGMVRSNFAFGTPGDYEAIETLGDKSLVVARSDGTLFHIRKNKGRKQVREIASPLDKEADVEGLAYDPERERLLVACKGRAGKARRFRKAKAVFAVSLPKFQWDEEPLFLIRDKDIEDYLDDYPIEGIDPDEATKFAPSAIAVHPESGEIYMLSTRARLLIVVDNYGEILGMAPLSREVHRQPEGLSFDADGRLYISNEGRGKSAAIHMFPRDMIARADDPRP
ncbi:MAG: SdiA-regulated domain-containing protein [Myxococcota bacterium]